MEGITIKKAKVNSIGYLEIEYSEVTKVGNEALTKQIKLEGNWNPHSDLIQRFDMLRKHLALLCEQIPESELDEQGDEHPALSKVRVSGYVIGGSDEHEGVTIIGRRKLANNRVLNLISPFTKWEDEHNPYRYGYELAEIVRQCSDDVIDYLGGKMAPNPQMELFHEEDAVTA